MKVSWKPSRLFSFAASLSSLSSAANAAPPQLQAVQVPRVSPPLLQLNQISRPDTPLLVGMTGGYAVQLPAMAQKDAFELGSGFAIGRTSAPPVLAEAPNGDLLSLVPGDVPRRFMPLPSPRWEPLSSSLPTANAMVVRDGALYGVSRAAGQVFRYDFASDSVQTFGIKGEGPGQFSDPEQIAVDQAGRIYVGDRTRIVRIDDISGTGWASFGKPGTGKGQFRYINGLAVDRASHIYAVDTFDNRLVKIDDMLGGGWAEMSFNAPNCVATDDYGRIYVCEAESWRLTSIDNMDGAGRVSFAASRDADWPYGSFGHVTPARRGPARTPIR